MKMQVAESITDRVYNLLRYYKYGNWGTFDRITSKVFGSIDLELELKFSREFRNRIFHYLRAIGLIEVCNTRHTTKWSVTNEAIVHINQNLHTIVGSAKFKEATLASLNSKDFSIEPCDPIDGASISLFPTAVKIRENPEIIHRQSAQRDIQFIPNYQTKVFSVLPSMEDAIKSVVTKSQRAGIFEQGEADFYDFQNGEWIPFNGHSPSEDGLYRKKYRFGAPDYFISTKLKNHSVVYEVMEKEWFFLSAVHLLKKHIKLRINTTNKALEIPKIVHLPALIERILRSGTLHLPDFNNEWRVYKNIPEKHVRFFTTLYPQFKME